MCEKLNNGRKQRKKLLMTRRAMTVSVSGTRARVSARIGGGVGSGSMAMAATVRMRRVTSGVRMMSGMG